MNTSRLAITGAEDRPPSPPCPSCGRTMVYHSNLFRYQCHRCCLDAKEKAEREETFPLPWWIWLIMILIFALFFAIYILGQNAGGGPTNLTHSDGTVDVVASQWAGLAYLVVLVVALVVAHLLKAGKERCPSCGKVLHLVREVQKYKCLQCGAWYEREDIEVEVVD